MSDDCIFCAIASGDAPGYRVREGDDVVAFLDANPLARGHTLVVPREHHQHLQEVPDETAAALFETVHDVVPAVEAAVDADATNVGINNGEVAGQVVPHVHCHVIPRFEGDGGRPVHAVAASQEDLSDDELAAVAADVRAER